MPEENKEVIAQIPQRIASLDNFMSGLPGANEIMSNLGKAAIEEKVITFKDKTPSPENTSGTGNSTVENSANTESNSTAGDEKKNITEANKVVNAPAATNDDVEDELTDEEKSNPLLNKVIKQKPAKGDFKFENIDQVREASKKTLGIEIKDDKDFGKVFSSALKWRDDAQKLPAVEEQLKEVSGILENAPSSIIDALRAYYNGDENWTAPIFSMPKFDFSKPVEKQDIKVLVNTYFPGEFSEEDFNEGDKPKSLVIAEKAAKEKFLTDKRELESQSAKQIADATLRKEARTESITGSLKVLKDSFPDLDKSDLKDIQKVMDSGDVNSLFFNKNGSFKPEAAKKLLMAMYGEDTIKALTKRTERRAETKANEDILTRGADSPKPTKNAGTEKNEGVNQEVMQKVEHFKSGVNKKLTY